MEALVGRLAMQVKRLAERLDPNPTFPPKGKEESGDVEFRLTEEQARLLGQVMEKEYKEYVRVLGDGFHASVVRNGINVMRIALVLSVLRNGFDISRSASDSIVCSEEDFQTAMVIGTKMLLHAADAYNQITEENKEAVPSIKGSYQKETFFVSLPESFSTGECIALAGKMGVAQRTAERYISQMVSTGQLINLKHGIYKKCV